MFLFFIMFLIMPMVATVFWACVFGVASFCLYVVLSACISSGMRVRMTVGRLIFFLLAVLVLTSFKVAEITGSGTIAFCNGMCGVFVLFKLLDCWMFACVSAGGEADASKGYAGMFGILPCSWTQPLPARTPSFPTPARTPRIARPRLRASRPVPESGMIPSEELCAVMEDDAMVDAEVERALNPVVFPDQQSCLAGAEQVNDAIDLCIEELNRAPQSASFVIGQPMLMKALMGFSAYGHAISDFVRRRTG